MQSIYVCWKVSFRNEAIEIAVSKIYTNHVFGSPLNRCAELCANSFKLHDEKPVCNNCIEDNDSGVFKCSENRNHSVLCDECHPNKVDYYCRDEEKSKKIPCPDCNGIRTVVECSNE